jgi:hypothetical protein
VPNLREVVVLVEGESDVAAIRALAHARGLAGGFELVAMGGVTNIRRHVARLVGDRPGLTAYGVCDAGERRFLERARPALSEVFVCERDLEDELIRALGADAVVELLDELGELGRFRTFQGQPEWRERPVVEQLRRFAGTRSGRKAVFARRLAAELTPGSTPAPLARLLDRVAHATATG